MQQIQHPHVQQAYENLHALSADKKAWYQQLAREMAQHDEATLCAKFGELPSSVEEQLQVAEPAQLEHWADRVLFAETLEQMFSEH